MMRRIGVGEVGEKWNGESGVRIDLALTPRKTSSHLFEPAASLEETHNSSR
jgi:hypothetical protein